MKLEKRYTLPYQLQECFTTLRDEVEYLSTLLPNVKTYELLEKKPLGNGKLRTVERWGAHAPIPGVLRHLLKPAMLVWDTENLWDEKNFSCEWKVTPKHFANVFHCSGGWKMKPGEDAETQVNLRGEVSARIPILGSLIEQLITMHFYKNLDVNMDVLQEAIENIRSGRKGGNRAGHRKVKKRGTG